MTKENKNRKACCKDVFNSFLVEDADYAGYYDIPVVYGSDAIPKKLIRFSDCLSSTEYDGWIHFYEDDYKFNRLWNNPKKYLKILKKFEGVILPDFSLYRDMPLVMQIWNIYRSRAIGNWLESNGIKVIINIRYSDERTYSIACLGVRINSVIAIGSHGCLKNREDRKYFLEGLDVIVNQLQPAAIIVYGKAPAVFFDKYKNIGINIVQFDSCYALSHKEMI